MIRKPLRKQAFLGILMVLMMTVMFHRLATMNNSGDWKKKLDKYPQVNRIVIQPPKGEPIEIESETMLQQVKRYFEIKKDISIHKGVIESKIKGTPANIDFYIDDKPLFSVQIYALKEAALNEDNPGESFSGYIAGKPYAFKMEGRNVSITASDAQLDKYLDKLLR
ncbi:MAG: hypothetical protein Q3993_02030 [Filifactor alocis]|nr:hypothetical protein [Filifactor alocis]